MNHCHLPPLLITLLVALLATPVAAQQDPPPAALDELRQAFAKLEAKLDGDQPPPIAERKASLLRFLEQLPARPTSRDWQKLSVRVRLRLARCQLFALAPDEALTQFDHLLRIGRQQLDRDLCGRSLFGMLRCHELTGDRAAAQKIARVLLTEFQDTHYGRMAKQAVLRLDGKANELRNGRPAPSMAPRLDLSGKSRSSRDLAGKPALLVFWSPASPASVASLTRIWKGWQQGGGDEARLIAVAVAPRTQALSDLVSKKPWRHCVLCCEQDYLDPLVVEYGVEGLPRSFLLGPDGTLLGSNLRAAEIKERLHKLNDGDNGRRKR